MRNLPQPGQAAKISQKTSSSAASLHSRMSAPRNPQGPRQAKAQHKTPTLPRKMRFSRNTEIPITNSQQDHQQPFSVAHFGETTPMPKKYSSLALMWLLGK